MIAYAFDVFDQTVSILEDVGVDLLKNVFRLFLVFNVNGIGVIDQTCGDRFKFYRFVFNGKIRKDFKKIVHGDYLREKLYFNKF